MINFDIANQSKTLIIRKQKRVNLSETPVI